MESEKIMRLFFFLPLLGIVSEKHRWVFTQCLLLVFLPSCSTLTFNRVFNLPALHSESCAVLTPCPNSKRASDYHIASSNIRYTESTLNPLNMHFCYAKLTNHVSISYALKIRLET